MREETGEREQVRGKQESGNRGREKKKKGERGERMYMLMHWLA